MGKIITNNLPREFNRDKKKREAISKISRGGGITLQDLTKRSKGK